MARPQLRLFILGLTVTAAALCAGIARADTPNLIGNITGSLIGGNCGATTQAFAAWGDPRPYFFTSNGGFESGAAGWNLVGGAQVVPGNEPFFLHSSSDRSSLLIPNGASATSPTTCFGLLTPGVRFVAIAPSGPATLHVRLIARGLLGILSILDGGTMQVGPTWAPTPIFSTLGSQLNVPLGTKSIQVELTASGDVQVDDLFIDPFLMR